MSAIIVLTPVIITAWPVIAPILTAAVASLGFTAMQHAAASRQKVAATTREEIEVDNSEILAGTAGRDEQLVVEREGVRAVFSRDARGALRLCIEGEGHTHAELRAIGQELVDRVTQQYVYHRVVTEMKERKMHVVSEEVAADHTVKIRVRNW
jgi:hypothetical protein